MHGQQNINKSAYKLCLLCEGTVVGLKLPEVDVNKHRNALEKELICERRTRCSARWLVDNRITYIAVLVPKFRLHQQPCNQDQHHVAT
jgi:hypothetical protein